MHVPLCVWGCVYMYVPVHVKVRGHSDAMGIVLHLISGDRFSH